MKKYTIQQDITVLCLAVPAFPEGIQEAFDTLANTLPGRAERNFYGVSYMDEGGKIIYKAAAEEIMKEEGAEYAYEIFTIEKGEYLTKTIIGWREKLPAISAAFDNLMKDPQMDKSFPCIEWYKTDTRMLCMVKTG